MISIQYLNERRIEYDKLDLQIVEDVCSILCQLIQLWFDRCLWDFFCCLLWTLNRCFDLLRLWTTWLVFGAGYSLGWDRLLYYGNFPLFLQYLFESRPKFLIICLFILILIKDLFDSLLLPILSFLRFGNGKENEANSLYNINLHSFTCKILLKFIVRKFFLFTSFFPFEQKLIIFVNNCKDFLFFVALYLEDQ